MGAITSYAGVKLIVGRDKLRLVENACLNISQDATCVCKKSGEGSG